MPTPRSLAKEFHDQWLAAHPFDASYYGISGYDALVPDASETGVAAWRARVEEVLRAAGELETGELADADAVTVGCLIALARQELAEIDSASLEHVVSAMPFSGPAEFLAIAARTTLPDGPAAEAYLVRLAASAEWIDQQVDRLRIGAAKGRLPVAPLVELAIAWAEDVLAAPVPEACTAAQPPSEWSGAARWREQRDELARDAVKPALQRWVALLRELSATARPGDEAGLSYLPGGDADYARAIEVHTTLAVTPEQLHRLGLEEIERLEQRALELGATLGLFGLDEVHAAIRASAGLVPPAESIERAVHAIRRAESRLAEVFPEPLPEPCAVSPMPSVVAVSGAAPHYSPPRLDGTRPGTYWFNTELPLVGTGWELEGVAFHEAVPGHHLQLSRIQSRTELPEMQRQRSITIFSEGWGLYAEQLAEEMALYSGTEALLGALMAALLRAARLVIDTGLHAFGWGRDEAVNFFVAHVPMAPQFLAAEVDRYIAWPGQALAYLTGKIEILRAREDARERLGTAFELAEFHAVLLDSGSLPIPVLHANIDRWIDRTKAATTGA